MAFFVTNIALVGVMFGFLYMSFSTGFNDFVEQQEKNHVASIKYQLTEFYRELGSWQPITENMQLWRAIVEPQKKPSMSGLEDSLKTGQRISLYNKDKQVIVGRAKLNENPHVEPILLNNKVIGWIGLVPSRFIQTSPAKAFLAAQFNNYFVITLWVVVLAFIMAIVLSRHLTKPIKQIVGGTDALTKGNFSSRIVPVSQDELGTLSKNFNELAQTLEQNQQMRQQWVSDTSHELRTPLTVLRSHLIAIQDGVFDPDEKRIALLVNQVENLNLIVDDLAQLAHNDMANLSYTIAPVDLTGLLNALIDSYAARFAEQGLTLTRDSLYNGEEWIVKGDKNRLKQLFSNLLENSCRYTQSGGQVIITGQLIDGTIQLTLQDSAPGVLPQDQKKLFERFYRVEKSRSREHGGSGLGLALCKQIVDAHGGTITLDTSPLGGLEVTVIFSLLG
nr:ATP-binding protein [Alteromonas sp. C1M14]